MKVINQNDYQSIVELLQKYPETKLLKWNKKNIQSFITGLCPFRMDEKGVMYVPENIFLDLKGIAESNLRLDVQENILNYTETP